MSESTVESTAESVISTRARIPWQLWIVIILLSLEGLGNLLAIPAEVANLAAKILFIAGFINRWRPVYVLFLIIGSLHVLYFAIPAPMVSAINLAIVVLAGSTWRYFFRAVRRAT